MSSLVQEFLSLEMKNIVLGVVRVEPFRNFQKHHEASIIAFTIMKPSRILAEKVQDKWVFALKVTKGRARKMSIFSLFRLRAVSQIAFLAFFCTFSATFPKAEPQKAFEIFTAPRVRS